MDITDLVYGVLSTVAVVFVFFVLEPIFGYVVRKLRGLPPEPLGLPFLGYTPFIKKRLYLVLDDLSKAYGPVYGITLGSRYMVVISDPKIAKDAFSKEALNGRPPDNSLTGNFIHKGFPEVNGWQWKEQRKFAMASLKDMGFAKSLMEDHVREEIKLLLNELKATNGQPMDIRHLLSASVSNNICSLVFGKRWDYEPNRKHYFMDEALRDVVSLAGSGATHAYFPWLKVIMRKFRFCNYDKLLDALNKIFKFTWEEIKECEDKGDHKAEPTYYLSAFLQEKENQAHNPKSSFTYSMLLGAVLNFFGAGTETIRTGVNWSLILCACYPDIQAKLQKEIDAVIGRERQPTLSDKANMTYMTSFLLEIHRWKTILPLNDYRYTLEDTSIGGYFVPKDTWVLLNIWSVHHSPEYWDDPLEFKPERFLGEDGKVQKKEAFYPFSTGKRKCPGEAVANMEIYMYVTSLLQHFNVSLPTFTDRRNLLDDDGFGITLHPLPHKLCLTPRSVQ